MKKVDYILTETYEVGDEYDGFLVDINLINPGSSNGTYEVWLYNTGYGTKEMLFGLQSKYVNKKQVLDMIQATISEYIVDYSNKYLF